MPTQHAHKKETSMKKSYKVTASWFNDAEVVLLVDHDVLTVELATEINEFWGSASDRLSDEDGDVVKAVVRLFGARAIACLMEQGWADFGDGRPDINLWWTQKVIDEQGEGWPDVAGLGILIQSCGVESVGFDDVSLEEA